MVIVPKWSVNIAYSLATPGCTIYLGCSRCNTRRAIDLAAAVLKMNPLFSVWNRHPPCPSCGGRMFFSGSHDPRGFVVPLATPDPLETKKLHESWSLYEERRRRGG